MRQKIMHHLPLLFMLFTLGGFIFYWIFQGFYRGEDESIMTFSWIINSDWMMHLSQVQAFSSRPFTEVLTDHPLYAGEVLSYPFFVNWFSGMLLALSGNLIFAMTFPLYLGTIIFLCGIYFLTYQLTKNTYIAAITPFFFFFSGGLQAWYILQEYSWEQWKTLADYTLDLSFLVPQGFNWKSFFLTTYLPQRSFLWGMGVGTILLALFIWMHEKLQQKKQIPVFLPLYIGLGLGILSFIHTHTFLWFFALFAFLFFLFYKQILIFVQIGLGACITAFPFLFLLSQKSGEVSEFSLFPLYRGGYETFFEAVNPLPEIIQNIVHIPIYWIWNWGLLFVLGICMLIPSLWKKVFSKNTTSPSPLFFPVFWVSSILLVIFSIIQLQGNPWDNTKVHLWSSLFFAMVAASTVVTIWKMNISGKIIAIAISTILTLSGILMAHSGINDTPFVVFTEEDQRKAEKIQTIVPHNETILTSDYFHHFVSPLTPHSVFLGYRGWIASYGMDWVSRANIATSIYSGSADANRLLDTYNMRYVFVDNSAAVEYSTTINTQYFSQYFEQILSFPDGSALYKKIPISE